MPGCQELATGTCTATSNKPRWPLGLKARRAHYCRLWPGPAGPRYLPAAGAACWLEAGPVLAGGGAAEAAWGHTGMGLWILRASMGKAQEGVRPLVISSSYAYPRQTRPNIDVQWPLQARDAGAKTPVSRRDFPANSYSLNRPFSSMAWVDLGRNSWRPLP